MRISDFELVDDFFLFFDPHRKYRQSYCQTITPCDLTENALRSSSDEVVSQRNCINPWTATAFMFKHLYRRCFRASRRLNQGFPSVLSQSKHNNLDPE